ncbi:histidinol dehydrogenase, partial [Gallibacterium anatis]
MKTLIWNNLDQQQRRQAMQRPAIGSSKTIQAAVDEIRELVLSQGDAALFQLNERFDKVKLTQLKVSKQQIAEAADRIAPPLKQAIQTAQRNIATFHQAQKPQPVDLETQAGVRCQVLTRPIN